MSDNSYPEVIEVEEEIHDAADKSEAEARRRVEVISVRGNEVKDVIGRLANEARVRKITVKNRTGKTLFEIPFVLGAAGVLLIGPWTAALLAAAWLTRVSILIEYAEAPELPAVEQIEPQLA
jgi:hypothetical protein